MTAIRRSENTKHTFGNNEDLTQANKVVKLMELRWSMRPFFLTHSLFGQIYLPLEDI